MARLEDMPEALGHHLGEFTKTLSKLEGAPWVTGPPLSQRTIALISTAGLQCRDDRPFRVGSIDYRLIPSDVAAGDLIMSHISTNYDRTGFEQDHNVVLPIDRLAEMAADGEIGGQARYHYSFMGATDPKLMRPTARELARQLKADGVDSALLIPV